jgi:hypothetical protein
MALARAALSEADRRFIIARSGGCCNKCRTAVFLENEFAERARIGDDAHIYAYSDKGPRGSDAGAPANRNARENIILLCKNCHAEVDQQPLKFTPHLLTEMRQAHYAWVEECFGQSRVDKPRFHYLLYLNMPRLDMYAVANAIPLPRLDLEPAQRFRDLGFKAGRTMAAYTHVLNADEMYARQTGKDEDLSTLSVGQYCFLEPANFRTVAIDEGRDLEAAWEAEKSILYRIYGGWKLICQIDPRWITTSTAGSTLRSGRARLCGVVRISRIDPETRRAHASPLFLAEPEGAAGAF